MPRLVRPSDNHHELEMEKLNDGSKRYTCSQCDLFFLVPKGCTLASKHRTGCTKGKYSYMELCEEVSRGGQDYYEDARGKGIQLPPIFNPEKYAQD